MLKFDKKNGMQLFTLFILLGASVFFLTSFLFVQHQAQQTAQVVINESLKSKFSTLDSYLKTYLESRRDRLANIVEQPILLGAVLEGVADSASFSDKLARFKPVDSQSFVNVYDFVGDKVYSEIVLPQAVSTFIAQEVASGQLLESVSYSIFSHHDADFLLVTLPVKYNGYSEGIAAYVTPLEGTEFFSGFGHDDARWFGIRQAQFDWRMVSPFPWAIAERPIPDTTFTLLYSYSPSLVEDVKREFVQSLLTGMITATGVALFVLYFLGRKVLVSPFQALYRSEQQLLRQSEELKRREAESARLARVAKYMRDAVVFTDLNVNVLWVNSAFERLTGYQQQELIGKKPGDVLQGPLSDREVISAIRTAIHNREQGFFELVNYNKAGQAYWIELALTPLYDKDDQIEGFMAVERDITERVELQKSLKQKAREANAASVAKSKFLAAMSHELRTPMNGILGVGELLQQGDLTDEQHEYMATLLDSGQHMLAVLNDILDFSKIEAGKLKLVATDVEVMPFVAKFSQLYQPLCEEKGLSFRVDSTLPADLVIRVDETRLTQILQNLLGNALKFTAEGGIALSVSLSDSSETMQIRVKDSGIGISQDKQRVIFAPFSQAESDTTRRFGGTGLGLSIVSELVGAMGGEIRVESELGHGSEFIVTLPITRAAAEQEAVSTEAVVSDYLGDGMRALIVEDTRMNALVLSRFLSKLGFECEVAVNGVEAVEKVKSEHFEVIFMDNHMPEMDGIQASQIITQLNLPAPPVLIGCTADAFEETRENMMAAGCQEVITKPINSQQLNRVLAQVMPK